MGDLISTDNFGFGFNDSNFSDRVLIVEIMPDDSISESCAALELKTYHVNSLILAAKSPVFYKLFTNGMRESLHKDAILRVNASEEAAFMELLHFIYRKTLSVTSAHDLLGVLMVADKFEVTSCMIHCIQLLIKLPMSLETVLLYLKLPSSVLEAEVVQPLMDATNHYLVAHYKDFTQSQQELMELPLSALEVVLGSDGLQVKSENDVFDFILKWARAHYTRLEERRQILTKHLAQFINFHHMSWSKLNEVVVCPDFDSEQVTKLVLQALCPNVEVANVHHIQVPKDLTTTKCRFSGRVYNHRLIKVVKLEVPWPHCVVFFDLKKDDCANLFPSKKVSTQLFLLGRRFFSLQAQCSNGQCFGLFLKVLRCFESCTLDFQFAVMKRSSKEFESKWKVKNHTFTTEAGCWGWKDMFRISWTDFMSDNNDYFINGILHLRVELIIHSQA